MFAVSSMRAMRTGPCAADRPLDEAAVIRAILEGTAGETGERFFAALVRNLAGALGVAGAWVTEYLREPRRLRALAFWFSGRYVTDFEYAIAGTPCEPVVDEARLFHIADNVVELFPRDPDLAAFGAVSYLGAPLLDRHGAILGHLAVIDGRPLRLDERVEAVFRIFAARAAAELQRLGVEADVRDREEQLRSLVASAMDAVVELDAHLRIMAVNPSGAALFGGSLAGRDFRGCLAPTSREKLERLAADLARGSGGHPYLWIPGGLQAVRGDGAEFPAEASLSRYEVRGSARFGLILRNVHERLAAERRIESLVSESAYLKEELEQLHDVRDLVGRSPAMAELRRSIAQVADTTATVLVSGETGTGKELVARAIHVASGRASRPLIKVNCAAVPASLIESEFFGHERGAFTGATQRREGRFALADGGTIFLDEVGELPLELQPKLLRVLQEGEFEPVGSSRTRRVDVRVIAATNRDLDQTIRAGAFREDLYYRLNVFPIVVPPLRERREDIPLLAEAFARRYAQTLGRPVQPLSPGALERLTAYHWPGNVRELHNLVERAVITARDGVLGFDAILPAPVEAPGRPPAAAVRTADDLRALERDTILRALEAAGWRIAGAAGAARRLGLPASTLTSRMKALGITRPAG
jgi:PAS domain S-box-containing protein